MVKGETEMDALFRDEVRHAQRAAMGQMFNLAREHLGPGERVINFASGHPSTDVFQDHFIKTYFKKAMEEAGADIFRYEDSAGYPPLRAAFEKFVNEKGPVVKGEDRLIVTYGSVEAISLTALALVERGDRVLVEDPSYVNAIKAFRLQGAQVTGVSMEDDGVNLDELEAEMARGGVKLFYTIPNFGNPSGITMSYAKRRAVYELAVKYQVPILEDNPYGALRYRGERIPDIKEFDMEGAVIHIGSMSKLIAPAMRTGFMVADRRFTDQILPLKAAASKGVTGIVQYVLYRMLEENDMYVQIGKTCDAYRKKLLEMERCMDRYFPDPVEHSSPDGGMYIWVTMPEGTNIRELCRESAVRLHIPVTPGDGFCVRQPEKCTSMRFNFVKESLEDIAQGTEQVGRLMERYVR